MFDQKLEACLILRRSLNCAEPPPFGKLPLRSVHDADRQNIHSASICVNAVIELYRAVSCEDQLHRKVLAFSISHDHEAVRIYSHYALIDGDQTSFHCQTIRKFDFTEQDGIERWTAYMFTRDGYNTFAPTHLNRIRTAINQLPDPEIRPSLRSNPGSFSQLEEDDIQSSVADSQELMPTNPSSQPTEPSVKKTKRTQS